MVEHTRDKYKILVRARAREDLVEFLKIGKFRNEIRKNIRADYHWRATITRNELKGIMFKIPDTIDYPNFKNACPYEESRSLALMSTWAIWSRFQQMNEKK